MKIHELVVSLRSSAAARDLHQGRRIHRLIEQREWIDDPLLGNLLLHVYARCGCPGDAKPLFDRLRRRNVVSWNVLAAAFAAAGGSTSDAVWSILERMPCRSIVSINTVLGSWARWRSSWRRDGEAKALFDSAPERCILSWNSMLIGCNQRGLTDRSFLILDRMPQWDVVSWTDSLAALARWGDLAGARKLFDHMPERNCVSWNAIVTAYVENDDFSLARCAFWLMPHWDLASFNGLLSGYAQTGHLQEAKHLFDRLESRCIVSWTSMITASSTGSESASAGDVFRKMPQWNVISWNTMITTNAQAGHLDAAVDLFRSLPEEHKSLCSWNAMIAAYVQSGCFDESKAIFDEMPNRDVSSWNNLAVGINCAAVVKSRFDRMPAWDVISWNILLFADAQSGNLSAAWKTFHALPVKTSFSWNAILTACAINGHGDDAATLFRHLPDKTSTVAWNALISSSARNGQGELALRNFHQMQLHGIASDGVTFTNVLVACSHLGMAETSWTYFVSMVSDHNLRASRGHFACMVDILARLGRLREAEELATCMPFFPNYVVWKSVSSASRMYSDVDRGAVAAQNAIELEPHHSGSYLLLTDLYSI